MSRMAKVARIERELERYFKGATAHQHGLLLLGTASLDGQGTDRIRISRDSVFKIVDLSALASDLEALFEGMRV